MLNSDCFVMLIHAGHAQKIMRAVFVGHTIRNQPVLFLRCETRQFPLKTIWYGGMRPQWPERLIAPAASRCYR